MRKLILAGMASVLLLLLVACSGTSKVEHFPVQVERASVVMAARLEGTLGVRDGYLAVNDQIVVLWPYGYTLDMNGAVPRVLDENGREVARYGERIVLGGGHIPTWWAEEKTGKDLPDWADETCWLTGTIVPSK